MIDYEYKTQLEKELVLSPFMFAGDVINSTELSFVRNLKTKSISKKVIKDCIIDIYKKSFFSMTENSKEIILEKDSLSSEYSDFYSAITSLDINCKYIFSSKRFISLFQTDRSPSIDSTMPQYLFPVETPLYSHIDFMESSLIKDDNDETIVYITDNPIQSLVYTIQNMDYKISNSDTGFIHEITYPYYHCSYNVVKLTIRNISKLRQQKLKELLK
jgi:hypothetical protein